MQGGGGGKVATAVLPLKSLLLAKPPPWPWTSRHNAIDFSNLDLRPPLTADVVVLLQLLLPPIMVSFDRSIIKRVYYHRASWSISLPSFSVNSLRCSGLAKQKTQSM